MRSPIIKDFCIALPASLAIYLSCYIFIYFDTPRLEEWRPQERGCALMVVGMLVYTVVSIRALQRMKK